MADIGDDLFGQDALNNIEKFQLLGTHTVISYQIIIS